MGFFETLRRPKALGVWADDGRIRAGEHDPAAQAFDFITRNARNEANDRAYMGGGMRGGGIGRIARGQENTRPMNVVYNQAPEMAQKQFNFMKDQAALEQKNRETARADKALAANDEYIQGRRENEMKQRGMDTNEELAKAKLALELGEREKLQIEGNNRMAQIAAQNAGNMDVARFTREAQERINTADNAARIRAAEIAAGKPTAATTISPAEEAQSTLNKARQFINENPDYADMIEFSDDGKTFSIKDKLRENMFSGIGAGTVEGGQDARNKMIEFIYGRKNAQPVAGLGSSALGASLGSAGASGNIAERGSPTAGYQKGTPVQANVVMMVSPDGRRLRVPPEKVAELEKAGAKRVQ